MQSTPQLLQDQRQIDADVRQAAVPGGARSAQAASIILASCSSRPALANLSNRAPDPAPAQAPAAARQRRACGGFTLIEMLAVVTMTGALTSVALPAFEGQLQRARRADVLVSMMQVQAAQERWRSNGARYGSFADIGTPARSAAGHYRLQLVSADEDGYDVLATASGSQARDAGCRNMALRVSGANLAYASGPDARVANPADLNAKCWNL